MTLARDARGTTVGLLLHLCTLGWPLVHAVYTRAYLGRLDRREPKGRGIRAALGIGTLIR